MENKKTQMKNEKALRELYHWKWTTIKECNLFSDLYVYNCSFRDLALVELLACSGSNRDLL